MPNHKAPSRIVIAITIANANANANPSVRHRFPVPAIPAGVHRHGTSICAQDLGSAWRQPDNKSKTVVARSRAGARGRQDHLESNPRSNGAVRPQAAEDTKLISYR